MGVGTPAARSRWQSAMPEPSGSMTSRTITSKRPTTEGALRLLAGPGRHDAVRGALELPREQRPRVGVIVHHQHPHNRSRSLEGEAEEAGRQDHQRLGDLLEPREDAPGRHRDDDGGDVDQGPAAEHERGARDRAGRRRA